jgi:hypothetical protein
VVQWYSKVLSSIHSTKNRERQKKRKEKNIRKIIVAVYNTTALWSSSVQVIKIKKKKRQLKK